MKIRRSFLLVLCFVLFSDAANILILEEIPSPSHHLWFKTVTAVLAAKGYNITVVSSDEDNSSDNIHYIHMEKVYETFYTVEEGAEEFSYIDLGSQSVLSQFLDGSKFAITVCNGFLKSSGWDQLLNYPDDFKFDLIIHDYLLGGCLLNFMQKFKNVPLISMTAFNDNIVLPSLVQSSVVPALNPYPFLKTFPSTFIERVANVLMHFADKIIYYCYVSPKLTSLVTYSNKFNSTIPVNELSKRSILYLTNYDSAVDGPQQLPSNVIGVGGLQIKEPQPLPDDLQIIADNSVGGLILFSLGTNVQSEQLGEDVITDILETFKLFPNYTFLWKINMENFPVSLPENVHVRDWIPQNDILAHNNTKLFITHAGLLSTQEAIWYGVPMLGIPIFADQFSNIHRSVDKGIAEFIYLSDLTKESLYEKLNSMLTNPKFRENIEITSRAFKDQKETPLERAVWWIEWAIRNPNVSHFKGYGQRLNFLQIESVDVYAFLTITFSIILWLYFWISFKIFKILRYFYLRKSSTSPKIMGKKKKQK